MSLPPLGLAMSTADVSEPPSDGLPKLPSVSVAYVVLVATSAPAVTGVAGLAATSVAVDSRFDDMEGTR